MTSHNIVTDGGMPVGLQVPDVCNARDDEKQARPDKDLSICGVYISDKSNRQ